MVDRLKYEATRLAERLDLPSLAMLLPELPADMLGASPRRVSERCDVVSAVVQCLVEELLVAKEEAR